MSAFSGNDCVASHGVISGSAENRLIFARSAPVRESGL